jgi:hypothetical protein
MNGKGDAPRPLSVSHKEYAANYERIFAKKTPMWMQHIKQASEDAEIPTSGSVTDASTTHDISSIISEAGTPRYDE